MTCLFSVSAGSLSWLCRGLSPSDWFLFTGVFFCYAKGPKDSFKASLWDQHHNAVQHLLYHSLQPPPAGQAVQGSAEQEYCVQNSPASPFGATQQQFNSGIKAGNQK